MNAVAEQLKSTVSKKEANALRVWRHAVIDTAEGKKLTPKQVDELADALFTLNRTAEQFDRQVNDCRLLLDTRENLAALPTREQDEAERAKISARQIEIDRIIPELQQEKAQNAHWFMTLSSARVQCETQIERLERDLAELFAAE